jgi:hypothetical protein
MNGFEGFGCCKTVWCAPKHYIYFSTVWLYSGLISFRTTTRNVTSSRHSCEVDVAPKLLPNCKLYYPQHPGFETNQCLYRPCEDGIRTRRPAKRLLLLPRHRKARLTWCRYRIQDWVNTLFTGESQSHLNSNDSCDRVHRLVGERYTDVFV